MLMAVTVHEFCHGLAAFRLGDDTAHYAGRLTLNPIAHLDLIGSILLPILLSVASRGAFTFGWAKPVPVNPVRFRRDVTMRGGMAIVAAAGPLSNILLAGIFALLFRLSAVNPSPFFGTAAGLAEYAVTLNLFLAFFNLVPVPPLDGSKVLIPFLPHGAARALIRLEAYGFMIVILLFYVTPVGRIVAVLAHATAGILLGRA